MQPWATEREAVQWEVTQCEVPPRLRRCRLRYRCDSRSGVALAVRGQCTPCRSATPRSPAQQSLPPQKRSRQRLRDGNAPDGGLDSSTSDGDAPTAAPNRNALRKHHPRGGPKVWRTRHLKVGPPRRGLDFRVKRVTASVMMFELPDATHEVGTRHMRAVSALRETASPFT